MTILVERSQAPLPTSTELEQAIVETLAYSDVFDYPLRMDEIHRYLPVQSTLMGLQRALEAGSRFIDCHEGFFSLAGRAALVSVRLRREAISRPALDRALQIGRILGRLPFIRMVALTGSLAMLNSEDTADLDYMLVAARGRVWTARGFALLLGRLTARWRYTLCPNLIISDHALEWKQRDLYSAHEICQMIPIMGGDVYARLRRRNAWTDELLPNGSGAPPLAPATSMAGRPVQWVMEWPLRGAMGNRLERWERERKVRRLSRQAGFGSETRFDADVCQGNFHQHSARTREAWQRRLRQMGIDPSLAVSRLQKAD